MLPLIELMTLKSAKKNAAPSMLSGFQLPNIITDSARKP